jgi:hypothetical protein
MTFSRKLASAIAILIALWFLWAMVVHIKRTPVVRIVKLLEVTEETTRAEFRCPRALNYKLVIGLPSGEVANENLGHIAIVSGGSNVIEFDLNPLLVEPYKPMESLNCYFVLDSSVASGFSRTEMKRYLESGRHYELVTTNMTVGRSVWLFYMRPAGWKGN